MAQTLLLGLGGTGSRTVNRVVKMLHQNGKTVNGPDGSICCAVLDTNSNDNDLIIESSTGVPVISTSKPWRVYDYRAHYNYLGINDWCPSSSAFDQQTMIDGASECRVKSRIAFMDTIESRAIDTLGEQLNTVLRFNDNSKIRVVIVSSVAGGTGSGMFIQTALWLRRYFGRTDITIRGIFLLPDVFIDTLDDIKNNKATQIRHYANAYAAIRELNTISKIQNGSDSGLMGRIKLDGLFDSDDDLHAGKNVYDYCFFIDNKDARGVGYSSLSEYENMVAQLVYMQLYAPMRTNMYSEEDNTFLQFSLSREPLYGSCGTAKASYPAASVRRYCALRAARDSLTGGWKKIDSEIDAIKEEKKLREKEGSYSAEIIDEHEYYIRYFEQKTSLKASEAGSDRFFISIANDTKNETRQKNGEKTTRVFTDKVEDFLKDVETLIDQCVEVNNGAAMYRLNAASFVADKHSIEELTKKEKNDAVGIEVALTEFDKNAEQFASEIVSKIFPYSMGDVNKNNKFSVYGLLTKKNEDTNEYDFVHPVAARYLLYKLEKTMRKVRGRLTPDFSREEALEAEEFKKLFDNELTKNVESSLEEMLATKPYKKGREIALNIAEEQYAQFINSKVGLCEKYEKECLQAKVFDELTGRLSELINILETFFKSLDDVQKKIDDTISANIKDTVGIANQTKFILGDAESKEAIYQSLDMKLGNSMSKINKSVIDAIYGKLCYKKRPDTDENKEYKNRGVLIAFLLETINVFEDIINTDDDNRKKVNLDICSAICKEADIEFEKRQKAIRENAIDSGFDAKANEELSGLDLENNTVESDNAENQRHKTAFEKIKQELLRYSAPMLEYDTEVSTNELGAVMTRPKTFWGYHPNNGAKLSDMGVRLGGADELEANDAYPENELYCYNAVYGLSAIYIPKFNELNNGMYYRCYSNIVNGMIAEAEGPTGEDALIQTPHLDKTWHKILPFITPEKNQQDKLSFFHGLWLAIGYGKVITDKDGRVFVRRPIPGGFGSYIDENIPVKFNDRQLTKTEAVKIVETLKSDRLFVGSDIPGFEEMYKKELDTLDTYVGTDILQGLTKQNNDLNPVNLILRYNETPKHDKYVSAALMGALEKIAEELANQYNVDRGEGSLEKAKYSICKKIYDSGSLVKGKTEIFSRWEAAFEKYKITSGAEENTEA